MFVMPARPDLRNVAIVAHVDHGKTTLVDAMLWQSGVFRANQDVAERVMDSMDLEREKGITILAKNTAVRYGSGAVKINIIDTPGHADFGGEVERGCDGRRGRAARRRLSEGPLPQTRFVLRKALEASACRSCSSSTRSTGPTPASPRSSTRSTSCSSTSTPTRSRSTSRSSTASPGPGRPVARPGRRHAGAPTSSRCSRPCSTRSRRPPTTDGAPCRPHVTNLDASPVRRPPRAVPGPRGHDPQGPAGRLVPRDGTVERVKITELYITEALDASGRRGRPRRDHRDRRAPGRHDRRDPRRPRRPAPLPVITVDEPSLSMTIGINTSPLAGRDGAPSSPPAWSRPPRRELVGNVSLRVLPTERPDTWEVQGRGELAARRPRRAMRREGFELTVGKPQVVTREVDGKLHEPVERLTIDIARGLPRRRHPAAGLRKGRMEQMVNHGTGWVRMEYLVPARGLIGFRTEFLTETRGTGLLHHVFEGYEPWHGELRTRPTGSSSPTAPGRRRSPVQPAGARHAVRRPGTEVYEGMIVGENARAGRHGRQPHQGEEAHQHAVVGGRRARALVPPKRLSLEQALEFCREDECVEVTPDACGSARSLRVAVTDLLHALHVLSDQRVDEAGLAGPGLADEDGGLAAPE
jgi:predicted membrane GTPase involved in stress response